MAEVDKIYDVKVTNTAWAHMLEHARNLAKVSEVAANNFADEFILKTETLKSMPERCPWLTHLSLPDKKYRKIFIGKHHIALFYLKESIVYIAAVVDGRADYGWIISADMSIPTD